MNLDTWGMVLILPQLGMPDFVESSRKALPCLRSGWRVKRRGCRGQDQGRRGNWGCYVRKKLFKYIKPPKFCGKPLCTVIFLRPPVCRGLKHALSVLSQSFCDAIPSGKYVFFFYRDTHASAIMSFLF